MTAFLPSAPPAIVFIEADVSDYQSLLAGLAPETEIHLLDPGQDGLALMAQVLEGRSGIGALHVISHGREGALSLGTLQLTADELAAHAGDLARIGAALAPGADILLYGCDVGAGTDGAAFIASLAAATGADVAASSDPTGASDLGGNWVLETHSGLVDTAPLLDSATAAGFRNLLASTPPTISGAVAGQAVNDGASIQPFTGIVLSDPDADASVTASIGLDSAAKGAFTAQSLAASGFSTSDAGLTYTHPAASPAAMQAAIRALVYQPGANHVAPGSTETTTFSITVSDGIEAPVTNATTTVVATSVNDAPVFVGAGSSLTVTQSGGAVDIRNLLHAGDADFGQTLVWSIAGFASHGAVSFSDATAGSGGADITPGGNIYYIPFSGYTGADAFTVQVSDGQASTTRTISVNVVPATPTGLDLASGNDSGTNNSDNRTNASILSFSGASAAGDSSSTVRVFVDKNNNGAGDAGDASATANVSNGSWSVGGVDVSGFGDGTYKVYAQVTSSSGNLTSARSAALDLTLDRTAPTLAITSNTPTLSAGQTATITFTFSEDPGASFWWDGSSGSVYVSGGTLGALTGSGPTRQATFTPDTDVNNGVATIAVAAGAYTDVAGNNGGAGSPPSLTFDTRAPAVSSIVPAGYRGPTNATSASYTVTFDGAVSGVAPSAFEVFGTGTATGIVGSVTGSGTTYFVTVNGISGEGTLRLDLKNGSNVRDAYGNVAGGYTAGDTYTFDHTAPGVMSVAVPASATYRAGDPLEFTVNFSETVTFDTTNGTPSLAVTLDTGGTVRANYKSGSGTSAIVFSYTVVAGNADANGVHLGAGIELDGGAIRDLAGNDAALALNNVGSTAGVLVSAVAPTVTAIERDGTALTNAASVEYIVTFSSSVTGVDAGDFTVAGSSASGNVASVRSDDGRHYTVTVDGISGEGELRLHLNAGGTGIVDGAGQPIAGGYTSGEAYTIDRTAPQLNAAIAISDTALKIGDSATVTFSFTEAVTGFTTADVTVPNGTLSDLASSDGGRTWTATLTPAAGVTDPGNVLTLNYAGIADLAGNAGSGSADSGNYAIDTVRPALAMDIAISNPVLAIGGSATVTFAFAESVTGFDTADVAVSNGALVDLASFDGGRTWSATLIPAANASSSVNVLTVNYGGIRDIAGNAGTGTVDSANYTVDTVRPSLAADITISNTALRAGTTATVTFAFSEAVTGFTEDDVTVPNGTLSNLASSDHGLTWTATLVPDAGVSDSSNVLTLDLSGIIDLAGNAGSGSVDSGNYAVDSKTPVLAAPIAISDTALKIGDSATVTFTFAEAVLDFTVDDVTVPHGTLSGLASSDGGLTWSATLAPDAGSSSAANVLTLDYTGIRNLSGNAGVGSAASVGYAVDTVRPSLASGIAISNTALSFGQSATVTFTFTEAVTGFTVDDVTLSGGALSNLASSDGGRTWSATLTPAARTVSNANVLTLDVGGIQDLAGNAGVGSVDSGNYAVNTTPPAPAEPPGTVIDGVPVDVSRVTLPGGVAGTAISVPIVTGAAAIPLATSGAANLLLAQLPAGYGLSASGANVRVPSGIDLLVGTIKAATPGHGAADQTQLTGNGQAFLAGLASSGSLLVETIKPVSSAPVGGTLTLSGASGPASDSQGVALVIDAGGLGQGATITLRQVDFAAIIGAADVTAANGSMVLSGDGAPQRFTVAPGDGSTVFAGGGADTLGFGLPVVAAPGQARAYALPSSSVLHGGQGSDTAVFTGARGDYDIEQHNGYLVVASKTAPGAKAMVINVEQLRFSDGSVAVQNRGEMDVLAGMYQKVLGRQADVEGIAFWADRQQEGIDWGHIALDMIGSAEFRAGHEGFNGSAGHDITVLYTALFGRAPDAGGLAFWTAAMDKGASLEEVAGHFVQSVEMVGYQLAASDWNFSIQM